MLLFFSVCLLCTIASAEVVCCPDVPPPLLPSVASCDYAIRRLEHTLQEKGSGSITFSPLGSGTDGVALPAMFPGIGPGYVPMTPVWCVILIIWQPRPNVQLPRHDFDIFPFSRILQAANSIRDFCLIRRRGHTPQLGREWIMPNQWVNVQFGGIWGPGVDTMGGNRSNGIEMVGSGNLTVSLLDGTNMTFPSSILDM